MIVPMLEPLQAGHGIFYKLLKYCLRQSGLRYLSLLLALPYVLCNGA